MVHRILTLLLIGTTLLGSSVCCCTLRTAGAESSEAASCCCQCAASAEAEESCPANPEENRRRDCPCHKSHSIGGMLDERQIVPSPPSVRWVHELSKVPSTVAFLPADALSLEHLRLLSGRCDVMPAGTEILIAHSVRRC